MTFYTLPWSRWNRTHKYVRFTIRNSWIWSEMSWSSIHTKIWTLKQLHHCTQWCSRYKRGKNCEESRWHSQSALVQPLATACLNRCQDLIGSSASTHSTFNIVGSCNKHPNIQRCKATKTYTLTPLTYELFFQNSSILGNVRIANGQFWDWLVHKSLVCCSHHNNHVNSLRKSDSSFWTVSAGLQSLPLPVGSHFWQQTFKYFVLFELFNC